MTTSDFDDLQKNETLFEQDCEAALPFINGFIDYYAEHEAEPVETWLFDKMRMEYPNEQEKEVRSWVDEIVGSLKSYEEKKEALGIHLAAGGTKEGWFTKQIDNLTEKLPQSEKLEYIRNLSDRVEKANGSYLETITRKDGGLDMNSNLDGYLAETHHIESFNLDAASKGAKDIVAYDPHVSGTRYGANSVDIMVKDSSLGGHQQYVERIQLKYGATAKDTINMIKKGDYCQRLVVPEEQVEAVKKAFPDREVSSCIEYKGIKSEPLTKKGAQKLRDEARASHFKDVSWEKMTSRQIARGVARDIGNGALLGAAIGAGTEIAEKLYRGEKIQTREVVNRALETGADFGVKAAVTGGLKWAVDKGAIKYVFKKGTPKSHIGNVVFVAIENVKIAKQLYDGKITTKQCFDKMEETTVAAVGGLLAFGYGVTGGKLAGAMIGTMICPGVGTAIGTAVGGFIGGTVAYMAGSATGKAVVKVRRKIAEAVQTTWQKSKDTIRQSFNTVATTVKSTVSSTVSSVKSAFSSACSTISSGIRSCFSW